MRTLVVLFKLYAIGVILQLVIGLGIFVNSQAAPFELCPLMQYYERELGKQTIKTSIIWPYFVGNVLSRYYIDEIRHSKAWR
jgi:hypothetical protein